jgi:heme-degrading monooxygenase HmoA
MIVRTWRGWTSHEDAAAYADYVRRTGLTAYVRTPGNRGAWIWLREDGRLTEIVTVSLWESREAIVAFAGADIEKAVFYPEDDRFLVERELFVRHYEMLGPESVTGAIQ